MKIVSGSNSGVVERKVNELLEEGYVVHTAQSIVGDAGGNTFVVFLVKAAT